jgi:hypothetical protein
VSGIIARTSGILSGMPGRRLRSLLALGLVALTLAVAPGCTGFARRDFMTLRRDPSGQAPDPAVTPEAVLQVYGARTVGWRWIAIHTWITMKRAGADGYRRYEVMGWGVDRGLPALRVDRMGPDNYWFGARPEVLLDLRGDGVQALIDRVEAAIGRYPYRDTYRTFPGPNSNTFIAWLGRQVPELGLELPPTAIGKDYLPDGDVAAPTPSGRGVQLSLYGLAGVLAGWEEGLELHLLGLTVGVDVKEPALKLPFVGRVGVVNGRPRTPAPGG